MAARMRVEGPMRSLITEDEDGNQLDEPIETYTWTFTAIHPRDGHEFGLALVGFEPDLHPEAAVTGQRALDDYLRENPEGRPDDG